MRRLALRLTGTNHPFFSPNRDLFGERPFKIASGDFLPAVAYRLAVGDFGRSLELHKIRVRPVCRWCFSGTVCPLRERLFAVCEYLSSLLPGLADFPAQSYGPRHGLSLNGLNLINHRTTAGDAGRVISQTDGINLPRN